MAIPDYQTPMLPLLQIAADGREHSLSEAREVLADQLELTANERIQLLPSGRQTLFGNRVAWAKTYLQLTGISISARRGSLSKPNALSNGPQICHSHYKSQRGPKLRQWQERTRFRKTDFCGTVPIFLYGSIRISQHKFRQ
jgi:restriction system protein